MICLCALYRVEPVSVNGIYGTGRVKAGIHVRLRCIYVYVSSNQYEAKHLSFYSRSTFILFGYLVENAESSISEL